MKSISITFYSDNNQNYSGTEYSNALTGSKWKISINFKTGKMSEKLLQINTDPEKCNRVKVTEFILKTRGY